MLTSPLFTDPDAPVNGRENLPDELASALRAIGYARVDPPVHGELAVEPGHRRGGDPR